MKITLIFQRTLTKDVASRRVEGTAIPRPGETVTVDDGDGLLVGSVETVGHYFPHDDEEQITVFVAR